MTLLNIAYGFIAGAFAYHGAKTLGLHWWFSGGTLIFLAVLVLESVLR